MYFWSSLFFELAILTLSSASDAASWRLDQVDGERGANRNQSRGIQLIHAKRLTHHPNTRYTFLLMDSCLSQHLQYLELDTVEVEKNIVILLRKVDFALMIPYTSLDCSYVVLHFWPNLSLVLIKLFLYKNKCVLVLIKKRVCVECCNYS